MHSRILTHFVLVAIATTSLMPAVLAAPNPSPSLERPSSPKEDMLFVRSNNSKGKSSQGPEKAPPAAVKTEKTETSKTKSQDSRSKPFAKVQERQPYDGYEFSWDNPTWGGNVNEGKRYS